MKLLVQLAGSIEYSYMKAKEYLLQRAALATVSLELKATQYLANV